MLFNGEFLELKSINKEEKMAAKISVVIPVYNAEKYLEECLNSVVNQTFRDIEIVIVNDGSTDASDKIIQRFSSKYSNIKVVEQSNKGVVEARIAGYSNATGDYIGWCDADDFCELNMFEELYRAAVENNADVVSCNYNFYPKPIKTKQKWFKEYNGVVDWKFIERNTIQPNKIVKRALLEHVDAIALLRQVGEGFYENVLIKASKIVTINKCLYNYRVGHVSTSTNRTNYKWYLKHIDKNVNQLRIIKEQDYNPKYYDYFRYRLYYSMVLALIILAYNNREDLYRLYVRKIDEYDVRHNKLNLTILIYNYGMIKGLFLNFIVPHSFILTKIAAKVML